MSRTKETRLLMETWRKFMNEAVDSSSMARHNIDKYGAPEGAGVITTGTKVQRTTNPMAKILPNNFMYREDGVVVHRDNGEPVNDNHYKDLDPLPGDFEYSEIGDIISSDTGEIMNQEFSDPLEADEDMSSNDF